VHRRPFSLRYLLSALRPGTASTTFVPAPLLDLPVEGVVGNLRAQRLDVAVVDAVTGLEVPPQDAASGWRVVGTEPAPEVVIPVGATVRVRVEPTDQPM
jgi:hypothetical protein